MNKEAEWKIRIVEHARVKAAIEEADVSHLFEYTLPNLGATESQLRRAEASFASAQALDLNYRDFLKNANGWKAFYQSVDLFGTEELLGGGLWTLSQEKLSALLENDGAMAASLITRLDVMPIATSRDDLDVFFIGCGGSPFVGQILWYAGEEVERFANFAEFFESMTEYERLRLAGLHSE